MTPSRVHAYVGLGEERVPEQDWPGSSRDVSKGQFLESSRMALFMVLYFYGDDRNVKFRNPNERMKARTEILHIFVYFRYLENGHGTSEEAGN